MQTLEQIIDDHLMSLDFKQETGTPMERAIFLRMMDVAIAYADQKLKSKLSQYIVNKGIYIKVIDNLKDALVEMNKVNYNEDKVCELCDTAKTLLKSTLQ